MRTNAVVIPIAALAIAFGTFSEAAAQSRERRPRPGQGQNQERSRSNDDSAQRRGDRGNSDRSSANRNGERTERRERADRGDRDNQSRDRERQRATEAPRQRDTEVNRDNRTSARTGNRGSGGAERYSRDAYRGSRESQRSRGSEVRRDNDRGRYADRRGGYNSGYSRGYYAPRLLQRRSSPRRYYGSGARLSLYFGIGTGYRYGSPYSGRVYGYRRSVPTYSTYGDYVLYGDLRLKVSPREAAVYVDGYYAGIVDDFDGFFQRLTLEVGPHEIEIEAEGYGSQVFDVYVDPERTIDLHADLLR